MPGREQRLHLGVHLLEPPETLATVHDRHRHVEEYEGGELTFETDVVDLDEKYCRAHTEVAPGRYLLLSIADTGTGIPEDARDHVYGGVPRAQADGGESDACR
ncbi:unnamed protein product [marine sediment metagenome]|uniref:Histidine kinase/HSP90-like ATPase domain-containing protein n=1 Tax=marine sediment metagenome TaxID=412755 RepID=X0Y3M3_9ZZZZ